MQAVENEGEFCAKTALEHKLVATKHFKLKEFTKSAEQYQVAIEIIENQSQAIQKLKHVLFLNQSRALYQEASKLKKDEDKQTRQEILLKSLRAAKKAVELEPRSARGHYILGRVALELGKRRTAGTALAKARKIDPTSVKNKHAKKFLTAYLSSPRHTNEKESKDEPATTDDQDSDGELPGFAGYVRKIFLQYRHYLVTAFIGWSAGVAIKKSGFPSLGEKVHQFLKLAITAIAVVALQGVMSKYAQQLARLVMGKVL